MNIKNILSLILFIFSAWYFAKALWHWKSKPLLYGIGLMILVFLMGN